MVGVWEKHVTFVVDQIPICFCLCVAEKEHMLNAAPPLKLSSSFSMFDLLPPTITGLSSQSQFFSLWWGV